MTRYRKKPVEVEARRVAAPYKTLAEWCGGQIIRGPYGKVVAIIIPTLEGTMRADVGAWVVQGVKGEFHPVRSDIFDLTYEAIP